MIPDRAPPWLVSAVAEGLQRLVVLRLPGAPPADAIEGVAMAWVDAFLVKRIAWDEARDCARIRLGFRRLAGAAERWPAPVEFFRHLPEREVQRALPAPPMDARRRAEARAMLAEITRKMRNKA